MAAVAVVAVLAAYVVVSRGPGAAVARLSSAVQSGDDVAVENMFVPRVKSAFLRDRAGGAAGIVKTRFPDIGSMQVRQVDRDRVWLLDSRSPEYRIELQDSDGWRIASVSYVDTETVEEPLFFPETVNETDHLPRGTRIVVATSVAGRVRKTIRVVKRDGQELSRSESHREILAQPTTGDIYVGTGKRGGGVSKFLVGSKFDKRTVKVTNSGNKVNASDGRLGASWRIADPSSGDRSRAVLLGPKARVSVGKNSKPLPGDLMWSDRYWYSEERGGASWEPTGTWIVVVEKNNRPAVWKTVTVK